jgi:hypothetical protein
MSCASKYGFADFSKDDESPTSTLPTIPVDESGDGSVVGSRRRRRAVQQRLPDIKRINANENMTLLDCVGRGRDSDAECVSVQCMIPNVHPNVQLPLIKFRMMMDSKIARKFNMFCSSIYL